ncbi:MaoC/PaaZ C-terminal domain-containing protein [Mycolicibacterium parafortuitum]|uniref:MaoC/PaaZ C-terminal domain-containing protein n=1 Tax=Mycolicibacterium parafortuitum TaxID=39692 RepID=UPI001054E6B4|nr:MaoC/PaaZ C-terminal domain-containing protein [Mycolicibacterium parafortuitum]
MTEVTGGARNLSELADQSPWYAEDLAVGDWMDVGSVRVELDEITEFAAKYDPLPIHLDATDSPFGQVIASGIHTMALFSGMASRTFIPRLALVAGKGMDRMRLPAPVYPGSTLTGRVEITGITMRERRADLLHRSTLVDQNDTVVLSFDGVVVISRRTR